MKKILLSLLIIISASFGHAQKVSFGTSSPNASIVLEINGTNKVLLLQRISP